jgi:hypothetical protein
MDGDDILTFKCESTNKDSELTPSIGEPNGSMQGVPVGNGQMHLTPNGEYIHQRYEVQPPK